MMRYQVENGSLRELIAKLFAENCALRERLNNAATHQSTQSGSSTRQVASGWNREWAEIARRFLFFIAPWPAPASFGMPSRPLVDPNSPTRYASEESQRAAEAAEVYDLVPRKYHPIVSRAESGFVDMVRRF